MTSMAGIREIRIMKMKPDIENMTLNEYLEYEAEKERRLWDNVRSRKIPTNYDEADIDSFHRNKKYNLYVVKYGLDKNPLNNHSYCFTPQFFTQPRHTLNTPVDKKDYDFDKILDDLFRIGAENIKRMRQDKVQDSIWEQDNDLEEDREDDGDDRDTFDMWDIMVEDVK
ncbi:hypothetical protein Tco_1561767 [Tanacetum coccineum]